VESHILSWLYRLNMLKRRNLHCYKHLCAKGPWMYHESNVCALTGASPVLSPAPSLAMLSTQQWPPAAVPTESAQIANGPDRGEAPQSRKQLLASAALQIRVGFSPLLHWLHALMHLDAKSGGHHQGPPAGTAQRVKEDKAAACC
jgi:hypothetical protein